MTKYGYNSDDMLWAFVAGVIIGVVATIVVCVVGV